MDDLSEHSRFAQNLLASPLPTADSPLLTEEDFCLWLTSAPKGSRIEYHRGFLMVDRRPPSTGRSPQTATALDVMARRVFRACEDGKVLLAQKRIAPGIFSYIAIAVRGRPSPHRQLQGPSLQAMVTKAGRRS